MPTPPGQPERTPATIDRRRFLQAAGGAISAATTTAMLDTSIARAASIPADRRHGTIDDVDHVVVLMQENRGFDHYFGTMRGVRGFGDPHPATLANGRSVWHQSDGTRDVLPFRPEHDALGEAFLEGTPHDWKTGQQALRRGHYDQWVPAKGTTTMTHLQRGDAGFHFALADAFTVCDAYHCSFLGNTDPNRYYLWTGWTGNDGRGGGPVLYNDEAGYAWTTYPERLEAAGVSWRVYQDEGTGLDKPGTWGWTQDAYIGNYGDNSLLYFDRYREAAPGDALYERARRGTSGRTGEDLFTRLRADVAAGTLPQVSYVVAPEAFSEHPNWPVSYGAWYIAQVLDALTSNPAVWARTAVFITYDENDGLFDHVVPPLPAGPTVAGSSTVPTTHEHYAGDPTRDGYPAGPYGLGVRVPMLVVSPWSTGGWVCSQTLDHTSVIRFMERRFGVHEPNITPWRRAVTGDLTAAFDFSRRPARAPRLMDVDAWAPKDRQRHPDYSPVPPADGALPRQEPGTRPARPTGYDVRVVETSRRGRLSVRIENHGRIGAVLQARVVEPAADPHSYTVGAGHHTDAALDVAGAYHVDLHGPDGFYRGYRGERSTDAVTVSVEREGRSGRLVVAVRGQRGATGDVVVTSAHPGALRGDDDVRRSRRSHRCHGTTITHVDTRGTGGWYDVTVSVPGTGFVRSFAGRLDGDRPGTSDPLLGR